ncbi:carbonate dehydratase [Alteromonadaceae bacterium BrNp21-10]|nr:carbonate dehydratase [Alteromonadaceae bacterium BrNp21-10]
MSDLNYLLENNLRWSERTKQADPEFFKRLAAQQKPEILWIGCSDSRVPANQIIDLLPGDVFVHRNVANLVVHTDFNCLSVMQFAIEVLKVKHVIVCGHYGCGGVDAAIAGAELGLIDNWLENIRNVASKYADQLVGLDDHAKSAKMCELNVIEQAQNVRRTGIYKDAIKRGQDVTIHSWIYSLKNGRITDLGNPDSPYNKR